MTAAGVEAVVTHVPTSARAPAPVSLKQAWLACVAVLWLVTLSAAALTAALPPVGHLARSILALKLAAAGNPPPSPGRVLVLAVHNVQVAGWPLLLPLLGAQRGRWSRCLADVTVSLGAVVNAVLVGLALGAYGTALLPFVPQLPVEWAGFALGPTGWLFARRQRDPLLPVAPALLLVVLLTIAAAVETVAVPHR